VNEDQPGAPPGMRGGVEVGRNGPPLARRGQGEPQGRRRHRRQRPPAALGQEFGEEQPRARGADAGRDDGQGEEEGDDEERDAAECATCYSGT
jgi:hypothetical protein